MAEQKPASGAEEAVDALLRHQRFGAALDELHDKIELLLIAAERQHINELFRSGMLKDEARRRIERELDLRQVDLARHWACRQ